MGNRIRQNVYTKGGRKMILAIYDLSGIQKFIFSTNKLKEIIGASAVVNNALFKNVPEMCGDTNNIWKEKKFFFSSEDKKKIVYIGGGNALLMFDTENTYSAFTRELTEKVFLQSGGAIRIFSACVELDETKNLSENQKKLMDKLDLAKKSGGSTLPSLCLPITAYDNNNFEPLVIREVNGKERYASASKFAKLIGVSASNDIFKDLIFSDKISFATKFDKSRKTETKNYVAIIHIDGNTMGIMIRNFVQSLDGVNIFTALDEMRKLSVKIGELYKNVLKLTVKDIYDGTEGEILFRPVVADGDDITVILESTKAFEFTEKFMGYLKESKLNLNSDKVFSPTAAAGIAFVGLKFPFSTAYDFAEQCCKNAKKETLKRTDGNAKSSMDFQVCYSNIAGTVSEYRKDNYTVNNATLIRRPYIFDDIIPYSYAEFKEMCDEINLGIKNRMIARSKLKGLRNEYGVSALNANNYGKYIHAHADKEERIISKKLSVPFNSKNEAIFFDYLDVMDIAWKGEEG